jgi:hypothetical protein
MLPYLSWYTWRSALSLLGDRLSSCLRYPRRGGRIVLRSSCWFIICNTHISQDLIGTLTKLIEATPQEFLSGNILFTAYTGDYTQNLQGLDYYQIHEQI